MGFQARDRACHKASHFSIRHLWFIVSQFAGSQTPKFEAYPPFSTRDQKWAKLLSWGYLIARNWYHTAIRSALLLYLLFHPPIFPSYLLKRIRQHALSKQWPDLPNHDWRKKAWKALGRIELASKIWEAFGWAGFLWDGKWVCTR